MCPGTSELVGQQIQQISLIIELQLWCCTELESQTPPKAKQRLLNKQSSTAAQIRNLTIREQHQTKTKSNKSIAKQITVNFLKKEDSLKPAALAGDFYNNMFSGCHGQEQIS